jgi:putative tryptophan/tyrosine transport system substrate-binding protein
MRFNRLRRREFISLLGGATVAWPLATRAQQPEKLPTIGFLGAATASAWGPWTGAFVQRLRELGWIEGHTIAIEYRWAEGRSERYVEIAAEFVRLKVDVIVTGGNAAVAAKQATSVVPIVFVLAVDPVAMGLIASLARPGGNVTGLSNQQTDLPGKRLELLREWRCARFRQLARRSPSKSLHSKYGERRISRPHSRLSRAKRRRSMSLPPRCSTPTGFASTR